jgi:Xaa-Pro aminopeptidase
MDPHVASTRVLVQGLIRLGVIKDDLEEALRSDRQLYKRYTLHNTSHMLGLDVHDCASARPQTYKKGKLMVGMVLTVEPGLYFQTDDLTVPAKYRGIGVRVEDDVLVTTRGCRLLSDVPRQSDDVERWMKQAWRRG